MEFLRNITAKYDGTLEFALFSIILTSVIYQFFVVTITSDNHIKEEMRVDAIACDIKVTIVL